LISAFTLCAREQHPVRAERGHLAGIILLSVTLPNSAAMTSIPLVRGTEQFPSSDCEFASGYGPRALDRGGSGSTVKWMKARLLSVSRLGVFHSPPEAKPVEGWSFRTSISAAARPEHGPNNQRSIRFDLLLSRWSQF
jgi:hypothetical protein